MNSNPQIEALAKQADVSIDPAHPAKNWLESAQKLKQRAHLCRLDGQLEGAYVAYLKHANIILSLQKHPQFNHMDSGRVREFSQLKKELPAVISDLESIKAEIVKRQAAAAVVPLKSVPTATPVNGKTPVAAPRKTLATPDRIATSHLFKYYLNSNRPRILVLDVRPLEEFVDLHFAGSPVCHIDPDILASSPSKSAGVSSLEILNRLPAQPAFHRLNFSQRHLFDLVVFYDASSTAPEQSIYLQNLVRALTSDVSGPLQRTPALLVGGFISWLATVKTASYRLQLFVDGNVDGVVGGNGGPGSPPPATRSDGVIRPAVVNGGGGDAIVRSTADYLNSALHVVEAGQRVSSSSSPLSSYQRPDVVRQPVNRRDSQFDNPFFNFASAPPLADTAVYSLPAQHQNYYPSQVQQLSQTSSPGFARSDLGQNLPQSLPSAPPLSLGPSRSYSDIPPAVDVRYQLPQKTIAPVVPVKRNSMHRAPSPPSPGNASSALTIHSVNEENLVKGAWTVAGGSSGRGFVGLKNLGNTCFMNSILQCLIATRPLSLLMYDGSYKRYLNPSNPLSSKGKLAGSLAQLLMLIFREENGVVVSPSSFKETIASISAQFRGSEQHDSQEFLAFLLDAIHEDLNQGLKIRGGNGYMLKQMPDWIPPVEKEDDLEEEKLPESITAAKSWYRYLQRNDSPVVNWFQGQMKSQLKCMTCGQTSTTYNPFMYLSVPIPSKGERVRLSDCLSEFVREETLDDSDSWKCPRCKAMRKATKKLTISRLPVILLVHLKRFSYQGPFKDKLETMVTYPLNDMDMFPYLSDGLKRELVTYYTQENNQTAVKPKAPQRYDLYAISNHYGGLNGGHYTATIRNSGRRAWFNFDDSKVSEIGPIATVPHERICTKHAYSLFYVSHRAN